MFCCGYNLQVTQYNCMYNYNVGLELQIVENTLAESLMIWSQDFWRYGYRISVTISHMVTALLSDLVTRILGRYGHSENCVLRFCGKMFYSDFGSFLVEFEFLQSPKHIPDPFFVLPTLSFSSIANYRRF